jgi:hypothetical protein
MYAVYSIPFLDKSQKCYYNVLMIEPKPSNDILMLTKQIMMPNLTGRTEYGGCSHNNNCVYTFKSIQNDNELMRVNEIPQLFGELLLKGYIVNSDLTKMLIQTKITHENKTLLCYIQKN